MFIKLVTITDGNLRSTAEIIFGSGLFAVLYGDHLRFGIGLYNILYNNPSYSRILIGSRL